MSRSWTVRLRLAVAPTSRLAIRGILGRWPARRPLARGGARRDPLPGFLQGLGDAQLVAYVAAAGGDVLGGQLAHRAALEEGVVQARLGEDRVQVDLVVVAPPLALSRDVAAVLEVADDAVGGALGDADGLRDLAEQDFRIGCDRKEHERMVGEEFPVGHVVSFLSTELSTSDVFF